LHSSNTSESENWTFSCYGFDGIANASTWSNYTVNITAAAGGDTTAPTWQSLGNTTNIPAMTTNNSLWAQGQDETSLEWAWLETNETGVWKNHTDNLYGSPLSMGSTVATWTTANFSWYNTTTAGNTGVGWRIWFNDSSGNENVTDNLVFTIQPTISISLVTASTSFETLAIGASDNTTDNSPLPFVVRNDGNYKTNITIEATDLWNTSANPSAYYQTMSEENETNSVFSTAMDLISTFTNMPATAAAINIITNLNWTDTKDEAQIEFNITVPASEQPGTRSSTVTILGSQA